MTERQEGGDRAHWEARYRERSAEPDRTPSSWVIARCLTLPVEALIADVAGGTGRHAQPLAEQGRTVIVIDFIQHAVARAVARHPRVLGVVADARTLPLRPESLDAIVCVSFLDRSLFPLFVNLLRPNGVLVYETFTRAHLDVVARGLARGPRNPAFLLEPNELPALVAPLRVIEHEETLVVDAAGERHVARVMAVKRA